MVTKKILNPDRIRQLEGGFSFIPHRFLTNGFLETLNQPELLLYIFLVLAADRYGLSYYSDKRICLLLRMTGEQYTTARDGLIKKDMIAFDGMLFQVLSLPPDSTQHSMKKTRWQLTGCQAPDVIGPAHACKGT